MEKCILNKSNIPLQLTDDDMNKITHRDRVQSIISSVVFKLGDESIEDATRRLFPKDIVYPYFTDFHKTIQIFGAKWGFKPAKNGKSYRCNIWGYSGCRKNHNPDHLKKRNNT